MESFDLSTLWFNAAIVGILGALYAVWQRQKKIMERKKPFEELPMPPKCHWFLGHIPHIRRDFIKSFQFFQECANEHGQVGYWLVNRKTVMLTDYRDARAVLNQVSYRRSLALFRRHMDMFLGPQNILLLNGKQWKFHRASVMRAFSASAVNAAKSSVVKVMSTFLSSVRTRMRDDKEMSLQFDISVLMKMITFDVFFQSALSQDLGSCAKLHPSEIATAFDFLNTDMSRRFYNAFSFSSRYYWIPTEQNRRHQHERKVIRGFIDKLVRERMALPEKERPKDLLTEMFRGMEDNKDQAPSPEDFSESALSDVFMTLLFAGYDTTSIALTYAVYFIATNAEVEQNCLEEIDAAIDPTDHESLQYCKAVLMEAMRLYPPATSTTRTDPGKPIELQGGFVAPKDCYFFIPIWTIHHMEEHFEKASEFHPERWVARGKKGVWEERCDEEESNGNRKQGMIAPANHKAFLTFSAGARSCAGMKYAMMESVLILSQLVKHLKFSIPSDYELYPIREGLLQGPRDKMIMMVKWRAGK